MAQVFLRGVEDSNGGPSFDHRLARLVLDPVVMILPLTLPLKLVHPGPSVQAPPAPEIERDRLPHGLAEDTDSAEVSAGSVPVAL